MKKASLLLGALCASTMLSSAVMAEENTRLEPVVVQATSESTLTVPGNMKAAEILQQTPGGVAVVPSEDYENSYSLNLEDTLAYVPGVYAQKRFGEEVRLAIRGSGLSRGFHLRGLTLLQDGIPFNLADGAADFQEADSLAFQRLEVFKGGNGLQYGSTTLGGAVNMVSKTGHSAPGHQLRLEAGSFNTYRANLQSGYVWDDKDLFVSITGTDSDGFREHDDQSNLKLNANMGMAIHDSAETRFYLSGNIIEQELPGSVSKSSALNDPKSAAAFAESTDWKRDIRSLRLANKTTFELGDGGLLDMGVFVNVKDLFHPITPFVGVIDQESVDYGLFVERSGNYDFSGHENRFRIGFKTHSGHVKAKVFQNIAGSRGALTSDADQTSHNAVLYGENHFYVKPEWALVSGLQAVWSKRDYEDNLVPTESDDDTFATITPKLGVLYEPSDNLQYFANVSRSYEPPTFSELTQGGTVGFTPVDAQNAWTAEIGSRGSHGMASWDISLYRAWVKDEMLQFTTGAGIPASTFNADDTIHQGVELGLALQLSDNWQWRNAYTYSDFLFDGDAQYGSNEIAGQPEHFYQAELRYTHTDGWFIAPNLELASSSYVDFANTLEAPGYGIVGLNAGYDLNESTSFYFDGRNLLDKNYISTYSTLVNSLGNTNVFYPGEGRAFFAGMRVKF